MGEGPRQQARPGSLTWGFDMERVTGVEPALDSVVAALRCCTHRRVTRWRPASRPGGTQGASCPQLLLRSIRKAVSLRMLSTFRLALS